MNIYSLALFAASLAVAGNAQAETGEALAKKHNCMLCHAVAAKSAGPAFKDIAAKNVENKDAQAKLEIKVRRGSIGVWGKMAMPPTAQSASDEDIRVIVQWMLSLK